MILVVAPDGHADLIDPDALSAWIASVGCQVVTVVPDPTAGQLDGLACIECGQTVAPMDAVARCNGVQLFACDDCATGIAPGRNLP